MQNNKFFILFFLSLFVFNSYALVNLKNAKAQAVIIQTDGKIVVAGIANVANVVQGIVARYSSAGVLDNTFGTGGVVTTVVGDNATFNALIQQADGKLVVGGSAGLTTNPQFIVVRLNTDGSLDTSFGNQGVVTSVLSSSASVVNGLAQQTDGKLVFVGTANTTSFVPRVMVGRLNGNGTLDTTFGTNGTTFTASGNFAVGNSITIQSDGKILVGANNQVTFLLARYTTAGILDTSFGSSGIATNTFGGGYPQSTSIALQSDGKIVQAGFSDNNFGIFRLTTTGPLDTTWGTNGRQTTAFSAPGEIFSLAIQSDGKVLAAGYMDNQIALARYTTTGILDTTYGVNGQVTTQVGSMARALSSALQTDGKLVIAGYSSPNLIISRYTTTGAVDNSFGVVSAPLVCDTALCAYAQIYNVSEVDILNNQLFTFDTINSVGTSNITLPSATNIQIGQPGIYLMTYIVEANSPANIQLLQNGNVLAAGNYVSQGSAVAIGEVIFSANANDILTLKNVSGYDIFLSGGAINASITLAKIA